jgi:signal transduction histidine kinase
VIDLSQRARATVEALASDAEVSPEPVDLTAVLRSEAETIRGSYGETTVRVSIPEEVAVLADGMLAAVFGNLLDNAVHHNDTDDPHIRVSVTTRGDTVVTTIADNGPGIPDGKKQAVFERGYSSSSGGFGLFFVRTMTSEYGGSVAIEDNDPRGTVLVVELPRAKAMPSPALNDLWL